MVKKKKGRAKVAAVRADNLVKSFVDGDQEIQVLREVDFSVALGEFVAITGASGTGKSTLVYQMGLLDEPTSGSVYVGSRLAGNMSVSERTAYRLHHFGFVFQDYALIPELRAWENVALPVLMRGVSVRKARKAASAMLDQFGMGDRVNHFPNQLSGGEGQRVSIARAIVHKPKVLFADEPTANLDADRSRQIIDIFHQLHRGGQTIVMVTHEMEYAREAGRLVVMHAGRVECMSTKRKR